MEKKAKDVPNTTKKARVRQTEA